MGHNWLGPRLRTPRLWRSRADEERKLAGREMRVKREKIIAAVPHETHERQAEKAIRVSVKDPDTFYGSSLG